MQLLRLLTSAVLLATIAAPTALGAKLEPRGVSSTAKPVPYHGDTSEFTQAAGMTQQTYCENSDLGMHVGDAKLMWKYGNGDTIQRSLVYHSKSLGVAVALEGTNTSSLASIFHDAEAIMVDPDHRFAAHVPKGTKLFFGFQDPWIQIADKTIAAIKDTMHKYNETRLTVIGHSLGAGMAIIAGVHLNAVMEHPVHRMILFGLPRTGNPVFADYVDKTFGDKFHWTVSGKDFVPHVAPRFLGYQHPGNMLWINPANSSHWMLYPGQENIHGPNSIIPELSFDDHQGVYYSTQIGASDGHCPATVGKDGYPGNGHPKITSSFAKDPQKDGPVASRAPTSTAAAKAANSSNSSKLVSSHAAKATA